MVASVNIYDCTLLDLLPETHSGVGPLIIEAVG